MFILRLYTLVDKFIELRKKPVFKRQGAENLVGMIRDARDIGFKIAGVRPEVREEALRRSKGVVKDAAEMIGISAQAICNRKRRAREGSESH